MSRDSRGFTLLEVLVATAILGVAITVIIQSFSLGLRQQAVSREYDEAVSRGAWIAENLFLQLPLDEASGSKDRFQSSWKVSEMAEEDFTGRPGARLKLLSCEVQWSSGAKRRSLKIRTLGGFPER